MTVLLPVNDHRPVVNKLLSLEHLWRRAAPAAPVFRTVGAWLPLAELPGLKQLHRQWRQSHLLLI